MRSIPVLAVLVSWTTAVPACGNRAEDERMTALTELLPERVTGWTRTDSAVIYDRETIFDYIDGAGEVYRSYAFSHVAVAGYGSSRGPDVTVEVFDMGNPADAYGVFSYAREREEAGIGGGYELRGRVLCFWQDRFYVCVASEERTDDSDQHLTDIARAISERLPPATGRPELVNVLPTEGLVPHSERFFHLHQSLNYHYYLARENVLNLSAGTDAVLARYRPGSTYLLVIRYEDESDAATAVSAFQRGYVPDSEESKAVETETGSFVSYARRDRFVVVVLDAGSATSANELLQAAVSRLTPSLM